MNKPSVTICIPAYNEQQNMDNILKQIFLQKQDAFFINKIIVASDGSTDNTVEIATKYIDLGVEVIDGKANRGQTYRQNEMIQKASSEILVLLNADLLIKDENVLSRLIAPILRGADLSAQWARPIAPRTFIERVLNAGFTLKYFVYTHHKNGNNIYTCVGHIRAFSKKLYSDVRFPNVSEGEDQYSYLACISGGYKYEYAHGNNLYFKLPDNFKDYVKYAKRIFQTQKKYGDIFSNEFIEKERKLPMKVKMQGCLYAFSRQPFYSLVYIILHFFVQQWALKQPSNETHIFEVSRSTKCLDNKSVT